MTVPLDVAFRFRPSPGTRRVDLLGEVADWRNAIAMQRAGDGSFTRVVDLPCGVYQYKFLVDGTTWALDPSEPRTRTADGTQNNVVVVDGAPEPWLFAPAAPWIEALDRGGVRLLVGIRKSSAAVRAAPRVAWSEDEGDTWSFIGLEIAFEEPEHTFFTAIVPASAPRIRVALQGFGAPRFEAEWSQPPAAQRKPWWWKDAAVYAIFVDRFRPGEDRDGWEKDPGRERSARGDLAGIRRSLDELSELGIDTLYLTPVHVGASVHRYDVVDPLTVDPALGGEAAYDALVAAAAERGMRIVQDISFAHVGRGFRAYEDVKKNGRRSRWARWFVWNDDDELVHYGKRTDAPLLQLENEEVQALVLEAVAYWAKRGVKGLRLDMTAEVPIALGRRIRRRFRELVPDGIVFGEVVPEHAWRWRTAGVVDAATDFSFHDIVTDLVTRHDAKVDEAFTKLARATLVRGGDPVSTAVRFLSTHDHLRLATLALANDRVSRVPLAYALLATMPGIPMLLYGEEVGLRSEESDRDLEDVWPDRAPMAWMPARRDAKLHALVRAVFRARRVSPALRRGSLKVLHTDASTVVFRREADGDVIDVAIGFGEDPITVELEDDELPKLVPRVAAGGAEAVGSSVMLPGPGFMIARRERAIGRAVAPARSRANVSLRDRDLVEGRAMVSSRPSRFFISVTERCNLRCAHCITHAPERTHSGTARTMTPAVLDALRDDLGLASYFAFVHGGESLTAPVFWNVLAAIEEARGAEPYVAHLLTNGTTLSPELADRLVAAGVDSLSVSLDGATAATNDRIRIGSRFDDICANIADVTAWRHAANKDLRIGLSFVVLTENIAELDAFVDLGVRLGVDWIKLEEGVPATEMAKRSLVSCTSPESKQAIARAMARGREAGLVMVDHTFERTLWRCQMTDEEKAFLEADEFANRGVIHPCRTPWDTVCVEPNGEIHALDFYGPILGNVTETPLSELWNGQEALDARRRSWRARICGSGPVTCV